MRKINFQGAQKDAIEIRNTDILVSAGAGSGKTTVLVERIIRMITGNSPIDIDRLLVLTFTDAAAGHMRLGIAEALNDRIKEDPNDANLRKQLALINKSNITTIHSFCLMVARKFFHKIDMDPKFRVADSAEIRLLKGEILDELLEEYYSDYYVQEENERENEREDFIRLAGIFDSRVGDEGLRAAVLGVHEYSRSAPNPEGWLAACVHEYSLLDGLEGSLWYKEFLQYLDFNLDGIMSDVEAARELAKNPEISEKYREVIEDDFAKLGSVGADFGGWEFTFARLLGGRQKISESGKLIQEQIKRIRDSYKKSVDGIRKFFIKSKHEMENDVRESFRDVGILAQVVLEFSRRFQAEKRERGLVDFGDFEHFCLQILIDGTSLTPEALEIGAMFDEIFIDEYQDSSFIQETILSAAARAGGLKRFMVGDVKQCIYQFRMARPSIFWNKFSEYISKPDSGLALSLMDNFRSRRGIIDSVNYLFKALMSPAVGGVSYDDDNSLKFAATFANAQNADMRTIVHIVDKNSDDENEHADEIDSALVELAGGQAEAKITAAHIADLFRNKFQVKDGEGSRVLRYSDIVILLRSKATAKVFADELKNRDIPAFHDSEDNYFLASEIMVILAILQIIDNPRQDIPLLTALFSDIFRFEPNELVEIGSNRNGADFYTALEGCAGENAKVRGFLDSLAKWRELSGFVTTSQLIYQIYQDTNFYDYVGLLPGGELRRANLMLLFEKATRFEEGSFTGIFNFVRYIEKLQKAKHNLEKAAVSNENEDLVRIMTIHKSKGLEFPVVFVCQMGKRFNLRDAGDKLVMDFELGLGIKNLDSARNILSDTFPRRVIGGKLLREQISEEMRILYVALTRCKEKLFLVGSTFDAQKYAHLEGKPAAHDVARGRSYMDWVLMALSGDPPEDVWDIRFTNEAAIEHEAAKKQEELVGIFGNLDLAARAQNDDISARLAYTYPHQDAMFVPAKMSVSEIKRLYFNEFLHDSTSIQPKEKRDFRKPDFMIAKGMENSAAARGIAVHTVLEHVDFNKGTKSDVSELIAHLQTLELLTPEDAKLVPIGLIVDFLNSKLAHRIRAATKIHREVPFAMTMPANLLNSAFGTVEGDTVVHGVIDCIFEEMGKLVIVDYKTESIKGDIFTVVEKYRPQMELYKIAAKKIFSLQIDETLMYFFDKGQVAVV
ncbi:MAG: helicase-exonuclease AddAB subunit AddA [Defluviitaleaceae bacterium]|nr:helicase-exonuclease AddAB subunit AddA [Defluviitaleaceae bacterium]